MDDVTGLVRIKEDDVKSAFQILETARKPLSVIAASIKVSRRGFIGQPSLVVVELYNSLAVLISIVLFWFNGS